MNIIFCNAFHNGDIHYSRTFISNIINDISEIYPDIKFFYYHNNPKELLLDIEKLAYIKAQPQSQTTIRRRFIVQGEDIYINTWVGCWKMKREKHTVVTTDAPYQPIKNYMKTYTKTYQTIWE